MRTASLLLVVAIGCGGSPTPAPEPAPVAADFATADCLRPSLKGQYAAMPSHPAFELARADGEAGDAAYEAEDFGTAAARYLDCARRYREVPDDHAALDTATANAEVCYYNAIQLYGAAGRFEAEGRAALERAADDAPRHADYIRAELADPPHDCHPRDRH